MPEIKLKCDGCGKVKTIPENSNTKIIWEEVKRMNTYEIINPHDHYTITAKNDEIASVTIALLNECGGLYFLRCEDDDRVIKYLDIIKENKSITKERFPDIWEDVADCFDSVVVGYRNDYEKSGLSWEEWHDENRTSYSDIGEAMKRYAKWLRDKKGVIFKDKKEGGVK